MKKFDYKDKKQHKTDMLFTKNNYRLLLFSVFIIICGFVLMTGGGGISNSDFNPEIFSKRRVVLAPIIIVVGYIGIIFSIFYND